ncbi:MAG: protein translocase subunit SecD, partial [Actinomycetota bacterium]|nr:protein translocase subunit SecD [Actinomycetota bacterium]
MATRTSRPGRTLIVFLLVIVAMFAAAAALGSWKPKLGLDLQGGTRITLQAKATGGGSITEDKLDEAAGIINARVNGAGVAEAEVTTQGSDIIVVEIPGEVDDDLTRTIGSTAQLRFRLVAAALPPEGTATPTPSVPTTPAPTGSTPTGATPRSPGATTSSPEQTGPKVSPKNTTKSDGKNRIGPSWAEEHNPAPTSTTTTTPGPSGPPTALVPPDLEQISDPYA